MTNPTTYGSRAGADATPAGGTVMAPVLGAGRLPPGRYRGVVLVLHTEDGRTALVLQAPDRHCHAEDVAAPVPAWLSRGLAVEFTVGLPDWGYVVARQAGRYRARRPPAGGAWLTDWFDSPTQLYGELAARGEYPALPILTEVRSGRNHYVPTLLLGAPGQPTASAADPRPSDSSK